MGLLGSTGRMGQLVIRELANHEHFCVSPHRGREGEREREWFGNEEKLRELLAESDYLIDFSSAEMLDSLLSSALQVPKPLILCTTGWQIEKYEKKLNALSQRVPLLIAPNTSLGACLQLFLSRQLAKTLDENYLIDVAEKHHRYKRDYPSGTTLQLARALIEEKEQRGEQGYSWQLSPTWPRSSHSIPITVERRGKIPGKHSVSFTSQEESLCLIHSAFHPSLFTRGALRAVEWLHQHHPDPALYTMLDVYSII